MGLLEQAGLVTTQKQGRVRTCRLGQRPLDEEAAWIEAYRQTWADRFTPLLEDIHTARQEIVDTVVGALDLQIPQAEVMAARGRPRRGAGRLGCLSSGHEPLAPLQCA